MNVNFFSVKLFWKHLCKVQASNCPESKCPESKRQSILSTSVQALRVQAFKVQTSRHPESKLPDIQSSKVQKSRVQETRRLESKHSRYPKFKCPVSVSQHPGAPHHASRPCIQSRAFPVCHLSPSDFLLSNWIALVFLWA